MNRWMGWKGMLAAAALAAASLAALGCDGESDGTGGSGPGGTGGAGQGGEGATSGTGGQGGQGGQGGEGGQGGGSTGSGGKLDLLFVVDNSRSMADKQEILALAVPDLVGRLVNPPCIGAGGAVQPDGPLEPCPSGYERAFDPVLDMHLGIISTSLGGHGADACPAMTMATMSNNDRGHLLARSKFDADNDLASSTYQGKRFLAWDLAQQLTPPGEADLDTDSAADPDATALLPTLATMVRGVGQFGCGYESQHESWYRFLVDPEPYESISVVNGTATPMGVDATLLQQRSDFLRPSSVLAVVLLSDENDCSMREGGQFYLAAQQFNNNVNRYYLPRPRSECAANPNDPCCLSCGQNPGSCPMDPTCYVNGDPSQGLASLTELEDSLNMRCFDQKRRFGIDFLYPIERYVTGLTQPMVQNRLGEVVQNPIFSDLNPNDGDSAIRTPAQVFLAGLVGVPWQDVARDPGDLASGFKSAAELLQPVGAHDDTWAVILGDPAALVAPADPFMVESIDPRTGTNPVTGTPISPPGGAPNAINGTEYTVEAQSDLQYACIFDLPPGHERDCSVPGTPSCECEIGTDNPLCAQNQPNLQVRAKAYPGIRHLQVLKGLASQAVVASLCPAQIVDASQPDFGYRPAMNAIVEALAPQL